MPSAFDDATDALFAAAQGVPSNDPAADVAIDVNARYARGEVDRETADAVAANPDAYVSRWGGTPVQEGFMTGVDLHYAETPEGERVVRDERDGHMEVISFGEGPLGEEEAQQYADELEHKAGVLLELHDNPWLFDQLSPEQQAEVQTWPAELQAYFEAEDNAQYEGEDFSIDPSAELADEIASSQQEAAEDAEWERELEAHGVPEEYRAGISEAVLAVWEAGLAEDGNVDDAFAVLQSLAELENREEV